MCCIGSGQCYCLLLYMVKREPSVHFFFLCALAGTNPSINATFGANGSLNGWFWDPEPNCIRLGIKDQISPYPITYYFAIIRHDSLLMCVTLRVEGAELNATSAQLQRQGGLTWMRAHNCGIRLRSTGYSLKWFCMYKLWLVGVLGPIPCALLKFMERSNVYWLKHIKKRFRASLMLLCFICCYWYCCSLIEKSAQGTDGSNSE